MRDRGRKRGQCSVIPPECIRVPRLTQTSNSRTRRRSLIPLSVDLKVGSDTEMHGLQARQRWHQLALGFAPYSKTKA